MTTRGRPGGAHLSDAPPSDRYVSAPCALRCVSQLPQDEDLRTPTVHFCVGSSQKHGPGPGPIH